MTPTLFLIFSLNRPVAAKRMYFPIFSFVVVLHLVILLRASDPFKNFGMIITLNCY